MIHSINSIFMMNRPFIITSLVMLITSMASAQILIKNAAILDVENKKMLEGYTVLVSGNKIESIDKGRTFKLPAGTEVIDATGKFLIPGLVDAHVHFFQSGGLYARPDAIDLRKYQPYDKEIKWVHDNMADLAGRYTRAGITTVVDVGATYNFLQHRNNLSASPGLPRISMTGPLLTTWVPEPYKKLDNDAPFVLMVDSNQVKEAVDEQLSKGADFIKIWYVVLDKDTEKGALKNLPLVKAAIAASHSRGLRVAVHATEEITARFAVEAGADFLVHSVDDKVISDDFIRLLKTRKTVLSPTLVVAGNYASTFADNYHFSTAELGLANPVTVGSILDFPFPDTVAGNNFKRFSGTFVKRQLKLDSIMAINLKKLADAGIIIATGTDAGNIGTQHAGSYMEELKAMQRAGLTTWQLLQASTINGAKAIGKEKDFGSVSKGKTADLLLLDKNPLDSIGNWQKIHRIIRNGKLIAPDTVLSSTPAMLAQQQLNAYNAHDLDAFLEPYADDVQVYNFPDSLQINGKEQMRKAYNFITRTPKLYCRLLNRIVEGNMVIDHEEVWGFGDKPFYGVAIYIIEKGKIRKVYFPN